MASTIIAPSELSDYSRRVRLEVTGGDHRMMRRGRYTITIAYSCLSQTIQGIHRLGGKITNITLPPAHPPASPINYIQPLPQIASPQKTASRSPHPQPHEPQNTTNKQQEEKPSQQEKQSIAVFKSVEYTFTEEW